jgi:excinuclease ABC subunit C
MVVINNGKYDKDQYRRFKLKKEGNDFVRLEEVVTRRFSSKSIKILPDLMIIDGGIPQLLVVKKVLKTIKKDIPYIGIAKNPDRILIGKENFPVLETKNYDRGFAFIKEIRDEAHRYVISYHKYLRNKKIFSKIKL